MIIRNSYNFLYWARLSPPPSNVLLAPPDAIPTPQCHPCAPTTLDFRGPEQFFDNEEYLEKIKKDWEQYLTVLELIIKK